MRIYEICNCCFAYKPTFCLSNNTLSFQANHDKGANARNENTKYVSDTRLVKKFQTPTAWIIDNDSALLTVFDLIQLVNKVFVKCS